MSRLTGKVAIVTGGGSGIGAAAVQRLYEEGAAVVVADVNLAAAEKVAKQVQDVGGRALAVAVDVSDEAAVQALVDRTVVEFGQLDVMVNNAGISGAAMAIDEYDSAVWQRIIDINLTGVFYGLKHGARVMKAQGRPGVVINVSSILGLVGFLNAPAYVAAKHGVLGLTKAAALELGPLGIRVVAVSPAFIVTPLISGHEEVTKPLHPIGRLGEPVEVANLIAFLASDEASFMTGATYLVDGGYTAQ